MGTLEVSFRAASFDRLEWHDLPGSSLAGSEVI
jgi:hypothetical protein